MCKQGADNNICALILYLYLPITYRCVHILGYHRRTYLRKQIIINFSCLRILLSCLLHKLQPRHSYLCRFRSIEHRTFRYSNDSMVVREHQLELHHRRLKILLAVRKSAAAYHHVSYVRKVCLSDMNIPVALLLHRHTRKRHCAVSESLHRRRHSVAVKRVAEQQKIALQNFVEECFHVVIMDTLSAVALAGETARAIFDMLVDNIDDVDFLRSSFFHAFKERPCYVHSVAFFTLGTAVQNKYFHSDLSPSASKFSADIFIINPCGIHVNPRSVEWIFQCIFLCSDSGDWGRPSASNARRFHDSCGNELPCLLRLIFISVGLVGVFTILVGTSCRAC